MESNRLSENRTSIIDSRSLSLRALIFSADWDLESCVGLVTSGPLRANGENDTGRKFHSVLQPKGTFECLSQDVTIGSVAQSPENVLFSFIIECITVLILLSVLSVEIRVCGCIGVMAAYCEHSSRSSCHLREEQRLR